MFSQPARRNAPKPLKGGMKMSEGSKIHVITGELISNGMLPHKRDDSYTQLKSTCSSNIDFA